ncbi:MAG: YbaB/EbfC family nucleoid-associated protein, partial [Firmicutes bacterium]|nr:YbaB/EbfC family nucleoid-associated protein [Bacillota bacterium]
MGKGMKAGKKPKTNRPMGGGGNMQKQLQQAQALQRQMEQMQAELEEKEFSATAGGGAIEVKANGKKEILSLTIDKEVVDPDDVEMLQEPEYEPSNVVDNKKYDKNHSNRFMRKGEFMWVRDAKDYKHYQCDVLAYTLIGRWLDYLKEEGVYDNTRI